MKMKELDESVLICMKQGSKDAFKKVYDAFQPRLHHFVNSLVKCENATNDILQEVFLKIWEQREKLDFSSSFSSLIYTMARNLTLNHLRKIANQESLKKEFKNKVVLHEELFPLAHLDKSKQSEILGKVVNGLPKQKKNIFILSKQQGYTNQEIAEIMGISQKTVKNHLWQAMQLIKTQVQALL